VAQACRSSWTSAGAVGPHHITKHGTGPKAIPNLLNELQAKGYKVVHMTAKARVKSLPEYDKMVAAQIKGPVSANARPTASVVSTVETAPAVTTKAAKKRGAARTATSREALVVAYTRGTCSGQLGVKRSRW
jgi:hypothetical protein